MTDLLLVAFLLLCLWKIQVAPGKETHNTDGLDKNCTTALRGLLSVFVVFHHLTLLTGDAMSAYVLKRIGHLVVACFFALSGYGLLISCRKETFSLRAFWKKRFFTLILPYLFVTFVYALVRSLLGENITLLSVLLSFVNGAPTARYTWFILSILLFYVFFTIALKFARRDTPLLITLVSFLVTVYIFVLIKLDYNKCWYSVAWAFPFGMLWAYGYRRIVGAVSQRAWLYIAVCAALFGAFHIAEEYLYVLDFAGTLVTGCLFAALAFLILLKIVPGNTVLRFLGEISFETYILHGLYVILFRSLPAVYASPFLFWTAVLGCTFPSAWAVHLLTRWVSSLAATKVEEEKKHVYE